MNELSDFLFACFAEDEAVAAPFRNDFGVTRGWRCDEIGGKVRDVGPVEFGLPDVISESVTHLHAAHIARWDPARVLAECEAKRRIVNMHVGDRTEHPPRFDEFDPASVQVCAGCRESRGPWNKPGCSTLRLLALPYADHPDYDERWRP